MDTSDSGRASKTALSVAMLRAVHQIFDGQPKILDDPVASVLFGDELRKQMANRSALPPNPALTALRAHVVLRSRYAEERLAEAFRRGVRQCVILGAGFDTFAFRQPDWAKDIVIFEVDHHATQDEKRKRLERASIPKPANLEFVAVDFESVSLREGLRTSSLDFSKPTFFSCLGVMVYLTREAVDAIFQLVAAFPPGSEIVFTFSAQDPALSGLADRVRAMGEPRQTHFDTGELAQSLHDLGFSEIAMLSPEEAEQIYFQGRNDGLRAPQRGGLAAAVMGRNASRPS
jgi:methyltransferase (TIGR00027 family)